MWQNRINHPIEFESHAAGIWEARIVSTSGWNRWKKTTGQTLRQAQDKTAKTKRGANEGKCSDAPSRFKMQLPTTISPESCATSKAAKRSSGAKKSLAFGQEKENFANVDAHLNVEGLLWSFELKSLRARRNRSSRTFSAEAKIKCGGSFSIAVKLSALSSAALHNPSRLAIWSVIMLLSGDITNSETASRRCSFSCSNRKHRKNHGFSKTCWQNCQNVVSFK